MSFTYNLTGRGTRDQLRLQISDTASASAIFDDEELDDFLTRAGSDINLASAMACRSLCVNRAKLAIWYKVNGFWMDRRDPAKILREMAKDFEAAAQAIPFEYESVTENLLDSSGTDLSNYSDTENVE